MLHMFKGNNYANITTDRVEVTFAADTDENSKKDSAALAEAVDHKATAGLVKDITGSVVGSAPAIAAK